MDELYGEGYDRVIYYMGMQNESVISLCYKQESYCIGGAHGNAIWSPVNYDIASGEILTLKDMFEDSTAAFNDIKENILIQCVSQKMDFIFGQMSIFW